MKKLFIFLLLACWINAAFTQSSQGLWAIAIHGGAGGNARSITPEREAEYKKHLQEALEIGKKMLRAGASSLDVVEAVVVYMEDCPLFNAGKGAVMTYERTHELDASIMNGLTLEAGAIAGVKDIKNPIKAARKVFERSPHVMLSGAGASEFAREQGLEMVDNSYFSTPARTLELQRIQNDEAHASPMGTVGCVVLDMAGNLAAGTSTGGMGNKRWGRIGDAPIIGAGTYADNNTCAVSSTGHGEYWIRRVVAHDIAALIEYKEMTLEAAANHVIFDKISPMGGSGGGVICVDKKGNIALVFNTEMMHRAWAKSSGEEGTAVLK